MNSELLYEKLSIRDYSNSDRDVYAQDLQTYFFQCVTSGTVDEFLQLLEKAEEAGKKIILKSDYLEANEYTVFALTFA